MSDFIHNKEISVIIVTYERKEDLKELLRSISSQTVTPSEVVIIDNSNSNKIQNFVSNNECPLFNKDIDILYSKNEENSLCSAKNIGAEKSSGDILLFLDDDVILYNDFIENILRVFRQNKKCLGVQGYIVNQEFNYLLNIIFKFFFLTYSEKNTNKLLPSFRNVYADPLTKETQCQWLMGGCTAYKKKIFSNFQFDENLKKYSSGEDADFSYRIYQKYPGSLYQTPEARLIHKETTIGTNPSKEVTYMTQLYHTYLFYKNIDQNFRNKLIFFWSRIGNFFLKLSKLLARPNKMNFLMVLYIIGAYSYIIENLDKLKKGNLDFFNQRFKR